MGVQRAKDREGDVLAEDAGVTVFGVTDTSQTGPS